MINLLLDKMRQSPDPSLEPHEDNLFFITGDLNLSSRPVSDELKDFIFKLKPEYLNYVGLFDQEY